MLLTISNLRTTAFYFENTKLLKIFLNNMSILIAKKIMSMDCKKMGHQSHKKHFEIQQSNLSIITRFPIQNLDLTPWSIHE